MPLTQLLLNVLDTTDASYAVVEPVRPIAPASHNRQPGTSTRLPLDVYLVYLEVV